MRENMKYNPGIFQYRQSMLQRMLAITNDKQEEVNVLFYGDSITELCDVHHYYEYPNMINHGIAGATTDVLLSFVDEAVNKYHPKHVVLMIGINDLGNTVMHSPRRIASNINTICECITNNIDTKIHLITTIPCGEAHTLRHHAGIRDYLIIEEITNNIQELVIANNTEIIDAYHYMIQYVHDDIFVDDLHLNDKGYTLLTNFIKSHINI